MRGVVVVLGLVLSTASLVAQEEPPKFAPGCDVAGEVTLEDLRTSADLMASLVDETDGRHRMLGLGGLQGHHVGASVRLLLLLEDRSSQTPNGSAVVTVELSGDHPGTVALLDGPACQALRFRWRAPGQVLVLTLGTKANITGVRPDGSRSGALLPVWGATETLSVTGGDSSFPQRLGIHPIAGVPVGLSWGPRAPSPPGLIQILTRRGSAGRAVFPELLEAVDVHGNATSDHLDAVKAFTKSPAVSVRVERESPEQSAGRARYRAIVEWRPDARGRWPQGPVQATVTARPLSGRPVSLPLTVDFVSGRFFSLVHVPGLELGDDDDWTSPAGKHRDLSFVGAGEPKESPAVGLLRTPLLLVTGTNLPSAPFREGPGGDPGIVRDRTDSFDVSLRNEAGEVAVDATIEVALCPRAASCPAPLVSLSGAIDGATVDEHGYLGLMVRKAPSRRGRYYWEVGASDAT